MLQRLFQRVPPLLAAALMLLTAGSFVWSLRYVYRTSIIGIDDRRYYVLYDDAMISMRYGWNLAQGHGLVYNPGEPVEGYTNLLVVLWMAVAAAITQDKSLAVLLIQITGALLVWLNALLLAGIGWRLRRGRPAQAVLALLGFIAGYGYFPLIYWGLLGGDAVYINFLLLLAVWLALDGTPRTPLRVALLGGLAALVRPDALLPAGLVLLFALLRCRPRRAAAAFALLLLVLPLLCQLVFRLVYYNAIVPNTYTLKLGGMPLDARLSDGWIFLSSFFPQMLLPLGVLLLASLWRGWSGVRWLALGVWAVVVAYQCYVGGDMVLDYWRLLVPGIPLLLLCAVDDLLALLLWMQTRLPRERQAVGAFGAVVLAAFFILINPPHFWVQYAQSNLPPESPFNHRAVQRAVALREVLLPDARIGVTGAGTVPYYTGLYTIDYLGKTDAYIASQPPRLGTVRISIMRNHPGHVKYDLEYSIIWLLPDYSEMFQWGEENVYRYAYRQYAYGAYQGVILFLRLDSPQVRWDRVTVFPWPGAAR